MKNLNARHSENLEKQRNTYQTEIGGIIFF